jgi:hypothetical protein
MINLYSLLILNYLNLIKDVSKHLSSSKEHNTWDIDNNILTTHLATNYSNKDLPYILHKAHFNSLNSSNKVPLKKGYKRKH